MTTERGMVIIGAGEAGARAAVELRDQGWTGPITMIGKEKRLPYELPPLSKSVLTTDEEPAATVILDEEKRRDLNISFISGLAAMNIDSEQHKVTLEDKNEIFYDKLLLTTGASPRKLMIDGLEPSNILYLRSFTDALTLRNQLVSSKHIVVIGGGFIGLEVAASAVQRGCKVSVIEAGPRILMRGVPIEIAEIMDARHREAGVNFLIGVSITQIDYSSQGHIIKLKDGTVITCDAIVAGIGAIPNTELAAASGLQLDNGIAVDEKLRTSDPDIFAAGDCCSFPHPLYDRKRIRLEAWRNALDQGTHAALNMLGAEEDYKAIPWFWSDQYELSLQVAGLVDLAKTTVNRDLGSDGILLFNLGAEGQLVSASGVGSAIGKEIRLAEMLIEAQKIVDPAELADPEVKLKKLLRA